jgi:hypothetical protein
MMSEDCVARHSGIAWVVLWRAAAIGLLIPHKETGQRETAHDVRAARRNARGNDLQGAGRRKEGAMD